MTDDRKIPAIFQRTGHVARLGAGLYKCVILAALCLLSSVLCPLAAAEGISINKAEARQGEDGYQLSASYNISLTLAAQEALSRGIPLYFIGEFSLTRSRWYWLDEEVFQGEQTVKLSYNMLTRQYRISRGTLFQNFASFEDAINILARQNSAAFPAGLMKKDSSYIAAARLRLDVAQLPKLLQVNAMAGKDWALNSDWYRWVVQSAGANARGEGKAE
ncbi:MAG: DUF4390 domain-containing protein [Nitrosomonadales bacterium]|nr:DUF4390 domain-containing protein [Nitrosomonadales bacterium]